MSCMSPQFVYQLRLDFYCHSLSACNLSLPPHSISAPGNCTTLTTLLFDFTCLWKPSHLILQPCSFPATCRMRIYLPIFEMPGPQQKAGAAHELKPLSIPPISSGNLRDPVFAPGNRVTVIGTKDCYQSGRQTMGVFRCFERHLTLQRAKACS